MHFPAEPRNEKTGSTTRFPGSALNIPPHLPAGYPRRPSRSPVIHLAENPRQPLSDFSIAILDSSGGFRGLLSRARILVLKPRKEIPVMPAHTEPRAIRNQDGMHSPGHLPYPIRDRRILPVLRRHTLPTAASQFCRRRSYETRSCPARTRLELTARSLRPDAPYAPDRPRQLKVF